MDSLTLEQKGAMTELLNSRDYCVSITAAAGCGKTFLLRKYIEYCPDEVCVCAYTGVAASLYNKGTTLHSFLYSLDKDFGKALAIPEFSRFLLDKGLKFPKGCKLTRKQIYVISERLRDYLESLSDRDEAFYDFFELVGIKRSYDFVLAIDESSMVPKRMLEMMLRLFKFKKVVLVGDKYQIAPVSNDKGYCYSVMPIDTKHIELTQVIRQKNSDVLAALRDAAMGINQDENIKFLNSYFRKNFHPLRKEDHKIFYSNRDKDFANAEKLKKSETVTYYPGVHLLESFETIRSQVEWLRNANDVAEMKKEIKKHYAASLMQHSVTVPASGSVMNLKNQKQYKSYFANGHIGELKKAQGGNPYNVLPENPDENDLRKANYRYKDSIDFRGVSFPVLGRTRPFHSKTAGLFSMVYPAIQFAYAYTYHKTQGMTIDSPKCIGVYVPSYALDLSGLMYVALTRCVDFAQINLHGKLAKEHFQYDFGEASEIDRIISNTEAAASVT